MKKLAMLLILNGVIFASGNALSADQKPQITQLETAGNLESLHNIGCINRSGIKNNFTPADLYKGMLRCVQEKKVDDAIMLFALSGVYGRFDTMRVADESAHQAVTVLKNASMDAMTEPEREDFKAKMLAFMGNDEQHKKICREIKAIGAPDYYPRYMVQHGMSAFHSNNTGNGLIPSFNASQAWDMSLTAYLHCPAT